MALNNIDKDNIIFKILKYYYIDDLSQVEIASKLNITRVSVSRFLSKAKRDGLIEHRIKYPKNFIFDRNEELEEKLKKQFNLKECIIASSRDSRTETLIELSNQLEKLFRKSVHDHTFIGVGWGVTLDRIVEYINIQDKKDIKTVPLIGGYGKLFDNRHSNNIARVLAEKFNGVSYTVHIPALLDSKEIRESIQRDSATKEIYNLAKRVEIALLCMSDLSKESTLYKSGQLNEEDLYYLEGQGVIGDINFVFIDKDGKFVPNEISERQNILFPVEQMESVKNVIGLVVGKRKAGILKAVLKGGLINILFSDEDAASMLTG